MPSFTLRIIFIGILSFTVLAGAGTAQAAEKSYQHIVESIRQQLAEEGAPPELSSEKDLPLPSKSFPRNGELQQIVAKAIARGRSAATRPSAPVKAIAVSPARHVGAPSNDRGARPIALKCAFDGQRFIGHFALLRHLQRTHTGAARIAKVDLTMAVSEAPKVVKSSPTKTKEVVEKPAALNESEKTAARLLEENNDTSEEDDLPIQ